MTSLVAEAEVTNIQLAKNGSEESPSTIRKGGKKSKVRKHAKKKKVPATGKDDKKEDTTLKIKQSDKDTISDIKPTTSALPEIPSPNANDPISDVSVSAASCPSQAEDVDKIKLKLEAQINARMGFGAFSSESIIFDRVCIYCSVFVISAA